MTERFRITREHWDGLDTRKKFRTSVDLTEQNKKNRIQDLNNFTSEEYDFNALDKQFLPAFNNMEDTPGDGEDYFGKSLRRYKTMKLTRLDSQLNCYKML